MRAFLCVIDESVWDFVENGYVKPTTAKSKWDKAALALANANSKAINVIDTSQDQWIKCFDFGGLRMVAEGLQNKYQIRKRVGVNRPNTLRWLS